MYHSLGWRCADEDFGHIRLTATRLPRQTKTDPLPHSLDPRPWLPLEDQEFQHSCLGQAMGTAREVLYWLQTGGRKRHFSRRFAYLTSQKMEGFLGSDVGSTFSATLKAAKVFGCCRESRLRASEFYDDILPARAIEESADYRIVSHSLLNSYNEALRYLSSGWGPILLGLPWQESLVSAGAIVERVGGATLGWHALTVVGFTHEVTDDAGQPALIVANSHGRRWGSNGFALVMPQLFDAWGAQADALLVGVSDLFNYRPRPLPEAACDNSNGR